MEVVTFSQTIVYISECVVLLFLFFLLFGYTLHKVDLTFRGKLTPAMVDGVLIFLAACGTAYIHAISSPEQYQYYNPYFIAYSKTVVLVFTEGSLALIAFRNQSYRQQTENKTV